MSAKKQSETRKRFERILRSKTGVELSINFIVMLLLSLAIFGFGIKFAGQFFGGAGGMKEKLDSQTTTQIETLLQDGSRVAIPLNSLELRRGDKKIAGLGILNVLGTSEENAFYITSTCQFDKVNLIHPSTTRIKNNEQKIIKMLVEVKKEAPSGTEICNVCVSEQPLSGDCDKDARSNLYDLAIHKLYIKIP